VKAKVDAATVDLLRHIGCSLSATAQTIGATEPSLRNVDACSQQTIRRKDADAFLVFLLHPASTTGQEKFGEAAVAREKGAGGDGAAYDAGKAPPRSSTALLRERIWRLRSSAIFGSSMTPIRPPCRSPATSRSMARRSIRFGHPVGRRFAPAQ